MAASLLPVWSDAFLAAIRHKVPAAILKDASLSGDRKVWTQQLTSSVVHSCNEVGWEAAGRGHLLGVLLKAGQEYLAIDVMAFDPTTAGVARWPFPVAAFELENSPTNDRVAYSLWKVLCLRARLRVVFAYRRNWDEARRLVEFLASDVIKPLPPERRLELGGETAVVTGSRGEGGTFPHGYFKFWRLDANIGRFEKV